MKHEVIATQPMFDRRLAGYYAMLAGVAVATCWIAAALRLKLDPNLLSVFPPFVFMWVGGMLARRIRLDRIATALEVVALFYFQSIAAMVFIASMATLSVPYADPLLSSWDRFVGFDWWAYFRFWRPYSEPLIFAYVSYYWQPFIVLGALIVTGREERLFLWLKVAFVALLICSAIFALFPAQAPYAFYGLTPEQFPERPSGIQWTFVDTLNYYKGGGDTLGPNLLTGFITFPSYHATGALLFTWALWPIRLLRWPIMALNVTMLVSIPIIGNHYFVDVPAGLAVGALALWISYRGRQRSAAYMAGSPAPIPS